MRRRYALSIVASLLAASAAAQQLKVEASVGDLETRARRDSNDATAHYNLALGYWSKKRWAEAEASLRAAVALDAGLAPAYLALAYLPRASGKFWKERSILLGSGWQFVLYEAPDSVWEAFERMYRHAFMLDPLVDVRIVVATEWRGGHIDSYDQALFDYNDGKWADAVRRLGELVADSNAYRGERAGLYERILWYHALALERLGRHEEAINDLRSLMERSERREQSDTLFRWPLRTNEYRYVLAYITQRASDPNGALALYKDALTVDLGLYPAHTRIADIYEAARMWPEAIEARGYAVTANPEDAGLHINLGVTLAKGGRLVEAEEALARALELNPREARAAYYLGIVHQQQGKSAAARSALERFIALAPSRYARQVDDATQRLAALR